MSKLVFYSGYIILQTCISAVFILKTLHNLFFHHIELISNNVQACTHHHFMLADQYGIYDAIMILIWKRTHNLLGEFI